MRYSIISKGLPPAQLEAEAIKAGARDIKRTKILGQIFCELDEAQADALAAVSGLVVKLIKEYKTDQVTTALPSVETISDVFYLLRSYFSPPLTGVGLTVAVLDSGIRKSHQSLKTKVVYEANFSGSPTADDIFGHGTQVAFVIAGGQHNLGEKAGVSPGASLMNIKVISDEGIGTDEGIILGIDKVCDLAEEARRKGLSPTDDMYPNVINLSFGGEDDGDADNPVRVACRQASQTYGLDVVAAAGNFGPKMTTITLPACEPEVIAVGAVETVGELVIWDKSSRGPDGAGGDQARLRHVGHRYRDGQREGRRRVCDEVRDKLLRPDALRSYRASVGERAAGLWRRVGPFAGLWPGSWHRIFPPSRAMLRSTRTMPTAMGCRRWDPCWDR